MVISKPDLNMNAYCSFDIMNLKLMDTAETAGNKFISLTVGICASNETIKIKMLSHLNIIQKNV